MKLRKWLQRQDTSARQAGSRLRIEELEARCLLDSGGFRPIDEVGNNQTSTLLGTANTDLLRKSDSAYANGFDTPGMGGGSPTFVAGPRLVSNTVDYQGSSPFSSDDANTVNQNAERMNGRDQPNHDKQDSRKTQR